MSIRVFRKFPLDVDKYCEGLDCTFYQDVPKNATILNSDFIKYVIFFQKNKPEIHILSHKIFFL